MSKGLIIDYEVKYVSNAIENYKRCNPKVKMHGICQYILHICNKNNKSHFFILASVHEK